MVVLNVNGREIQQAIDRLAGNLSNMRSAWRTVGEMARNSVRKNFDVSGRPRWQPLEDSTLLRKIGGRRRGFTRRGGLRASSRRRLRGNKILIDTGRLMNSITVQATASEARVGTNVEYAATHHFGRDAIPARPFLMLQPGDERRMVREVESLLRRGLL